MTRATETPDLHSKRHGGRHGLVAALLALGSFAAPWWLAGLEPSTALAPVVTAVPDRPAVTFSTRVSLAQADAQAAPVSQATTPSAPPPAASDESAAPAVEDRLAQATAEAETKAEKETETQPPKSTGVPLSAVLSSASPPERLSQSRRSHRIARRTLRRDRRTDTQRTRRRGSSPGPATAPRTPPCGAPDHPDIAAVGTDQYRVNRALVDHYTDNLREAARLAHVAWHRSEDGRVDGFRIRRIRCGSVLHDAGFRNGDVVHTVNGRPVRNLPQALGAYRRLRKKRRLWLEVSRNGDTRTFRYTLS